MLGEKKERWRRREQRQRQTIQKGTESYEATFELAIPKEEVGRKVDQEVNHIKPQSEGYQEMKPNTMSSFKW